MSVVAADPKRLEFLGLKFDDIGLAEAVRRVFNDAAPSFKYVVTPNVDHVVRLHARSQGDAPDLWPLYFEADYCFCDSRVLQRLARMNNQWLSVVPGSDLTSAILAESNARGGTVAIVGGWPDTISKLRARYHEIGFRQHIPPMGLKHNELALMAASDFVRGASADYTLLAVGSPQQELLALRIKNSGGARGIGLCIGASLDFLTGRERRAPAILQQAGLEWAYRLLISPRRLWRRYLIDGPRILLIAYRWRVSQSF